MRPRSPGGTRSLPPITRRRSCSRARTYRLRTRRRSPTTRSSAAPTYCATPTRAEPPDLILICTGTEVSLCAARRPTLLEGDGIAARVVSMPCMENFAAQDSDYRETVLPPSVRARVSVEAASTMGWHRWVGPDGGVVGMQTFGDSAPAGRLRALRHHARAGRDDRAGSCRRGEGGPNHEHRRPRSIHDLRRSRRRA